MAHWSAVRCAVAKNDHGCRRARRMNDWPRSSLQAPLLAGVCQAAGTASPGSAVNHRAALDVPRSASCPTAQRTVLARSGTAASRSVPRRWAMEPRTAAACHPVDKRAAWDPRHSPRPRGQEAAAATGQSCLNEASPHPSSRSASDERRSDPAHSHRRSQIDRRTR